MATSPIVCWICGGLGSTGEHRSKHSDLRSVFGTVTQAAPLYRHDATRSNRKVGSTRSAILKSSSLICQTCNSARTQPHDRAWEHLSSELRGRRSAIAPGDIIRVNRIFRINTRQQMLNVHLYFLKLFGCNIIEGAAPIDVQPFADSILNGRAHPNVYLRFGVTPLLAGAPAVGQTDLQVATLGGAGAFAAWIYFVDRLGVRVMFAAPGEKRDGLVDAWHPRLGTSRLVLDDLR